MWILRPCISLISVLSVSVIILCCLTIESPLNSFDSTMISYMAPHPPDISTTLTVFAYKIRNTHYIYLHNIFCILTSILTCWNFCRRISVNCSSVYLELSAWLPDQSRESSWNLISVLRNLHEKSKNFFILKINGFTETLRLNSICRSMIITGIYELKFCGRVWRNNTIQIVSIWLLSRKSNWRLLKALHTKLK